MKRHLKYLLYVLNHKRWVWHFCLRYGLIWRGIKHDWTKFTPGEWFPYAGYDFSKGVVPKVGYAHQLDPADLAFNVAWNHHQKANDHHWQYWVLLQDEGGTFALPMPDVCRKEMVADWRGAGRAQGFPDTLDWYTRNKHKMNLHPDTRAWVENELGYAVEV